MDRENLLNELMVAEDCIAAQNEQLSSLHNQVQELQKQVEEKEKTIEHYRWANAILSWKDEPHMQGIFFD